MANMPIITVLFSLSWVVGMVIFANYADCDPLSLGYISKIDEIVPFFVEDKFLNLPGLLGLVMAILFNSALTLAVSNLNSLATVTFEDFLSHIPALSDLKDTQQLRAIKIIGVIYGLLIIGISFLVAMLSGVIESSMLMTSATSGPLLGVFILAMLVPCANWKGAAAGMIFSHVMSLWITFGHLSLARVTELLPLSTANCHNETFSSWVSKPISLEQYTMANLSASTSAYETVTPSLPVDVADKSSDPLSTLYGITYMYYALIGSLSTVVVGVIVSLLTADAEADQYEEHLLHPAARKLAGLFPGKRRLYTSSGGGARHGDKSGTPSCANTSVTTICESTEKVGPLQGVLDENGRMRIDNGYVEKLNAMKSVSLDVTNEIGKSTHL